MTVAGRRFTVFPYAVVLPLVLWSLLFVVFPVVFAIWTSLHLWKATDALSSPFVGAQNYIDLITRETRFPVAIKNTIIYSSFVTAVVVPVGFGLAWLLYQVSRSRHLYSVVFFLPALAPAAVIGIIFAFFYNPQFGIANQALKVLDLGPFGFLRDSTMAIWAVASVEIWLRIGFSVLIFLAGLLAIPPSLLEAARVDGASETRLIRSVVLPLLRPVTLFVTVITVTTALQAFDLIYVMTGGGSTGGPGGPADSTWTQALLIYNEGLVRFRVGTSSSAAVILMAIVAVFAFAQFRLLRSRWED